MTGKIERKHGGDVYQFEIGGLPPDLLDYSANINPLGVPDSVRAAVTDALEQVIHYPDVHAAGLRRAISEHYGIPFAGITPGNGAVELLYVLCQMTRPRRILVPAPTFSEYERAGLAAGAEVDRLFLQSAGGFRWNWDQLIRQSITADIVFLCNPNNPTGVLAGREEILPLLRKVPAHTLVVVDESFLDFLPDARPFTCVPLLRDYPNLIILHSLTKFFAIPGIRLGFAAASARITDLLAAGKDPWNVSIFAQAAGAAALRDGDYAARSRTLMAKARVDFFRGLNAIPGIAALPPSVNFILADISAAHITSDELCRRMAGEHILVRDCANYPGLSHHYVRFAVRLPEQNERVLGALRKIIGTAGDENDQIDSCPARSDGLES